MSNIVGMPMSLGAVVEQHKEQLKEAITEGVMTVANLQGAAAVGSIICDAPYHVEAKEQLAA